MRFRHIFFDLGGVVIELGELPFPAKSGFEINRWFSSRTATRFERGLISTWQFTEQIKDEIDLDMSNDELLECFSQWPKRIFPGAKELLARLAEDYQLTVVSNCNEIHWPIMENKFGILSYFDHAFSSHLVGQAKPDEKFFLHVLSAVQAEPADVLFFDDNRINVTAANNIGLTGVLVNGPGDIEHYFRSNDFPE